MKQLDLRCCIIVALFLSTSYAVHFPIGLDFPNIMYYGEQSGYQFFKQWMNGFINTGATWVRTDFRCRSTHDSLNDGGCTPSQSQPDSKWVANGSCFFHDSGIKIIATAGPNSDDFNDGSTSSSLSNVNLTRYEAKLRDYFNRMSPCGQLDVLEVGNELDMCDLSWSSTTQNDICVYQDANQLGNMIASYGKMILSAKKVINEFGWNTKIITFGMSSSTYWTQSAGHPYLLRNPDRFLQLLLQNQSVANAIDGFSFHPIVGYTTDVYNDYITLFTNISNTWQLPSNKGFWLTETYQTNGINFRSVDCPSIINGFQRLANSGINFANFLIWDYPLMLTNVSDPNSWTTDCFNAFHNWNQQQTTSSPVTTTTTTGPSTTGGCSNQVYDACGGSGTYFTSSCCPSGSYCNCTTVYYHQCIPGTPPSGYSCSSTPVPPPPTPTPTPTTGGTCVAQFNQCGGINYAGPTNCCSGTTCTQQVSSGTPNQYYWQCL